MNTNKDDEGVLMNVDQSSSLKHEFIETDEDKKLNTIVVWSNDDEGNVVIEEAEAEDDETSTIQEEQVATNDPQVLADEAEIHHDDEESDLEKDNNHSITSSTHGEDKQLQGDPDTTPYSRQHWKEIYDTSPLTPTLNESAALLDKVGWPPISLLEATADEKRRLVVVSVNCPYIEMADNMIQSLIALGLNNYVAIPSTWDVHDILVQAYGQQHVLPPLPGFRLPNKASGYNNMDSFAALTKIRPVFLRAILSKGFAVYYSDSDTVWLANAFDDVEDDVMVVVATTKTDNDDDEGAVIVPADFQVSSDDGIVSKQANYCSCQLYFRPTPGSMQFLEEWIHESETTKKHREDQMAMNALLDQYKQGKRPKTSTWTPRLAPDPLKHPPGNSWFQLHKDDEEIQKQAVIVHINWVVGIQMKMQNLRDFDIWHPTGKLTNFTCGEGEETISVTIAPPSVAIQEEEEDDKKRKTTEVSSGTEEPIEANESSQDASVSENSTSPADEVIPANRSVDDVSYSREHWKDIYDTSPLTPTLNESAAFLNKVGWPPVSLLEATADSKRRLVLLSVNCPYIEIADNMIQSLIKLGLNNYVIVPSTWDVHDIVVDAYGQHHVLPPIPGFRLPNKKVGWGNGKTFAVLTKIRPVFVRAIVSKNFSVYYTDTDTVWLGNAFDDVEDLTQDFQVSSDDGLISMQKNYCSCQLFFRPTPGSLHFLDEWTQEAGNDQHAEDQMAMNALLLQKSNESKWTARLAPEPLKHPPGNSWFQKDRDDEEKHKQAVIIHNNWNRNNGDKFKDLNEFDVWHPTGKLKSFTCGEGRDKISVTVSASKQQEDGSGLAVSGDSETELTSDAAKNGTGKEVDLKRTTSSDVDDKTASAETKEADDALESETARAPDKIDKSDTPDVAGADVGACEAHPPMDVVDDCLRLTTPDLTLEYPEDAFQHFKEIHEALDKWVKPSKPHSWMGYEGPWIENVWIEFAKNRTSSGCLPDTFGPFIPILVPWTDLWVGQPSPFRYPNGFVDDVKSVLRPNVPYVTLAQSAEGLTAKDEFPMEDIPNVLVFSSGGYGHIPIPLFKQEEPLANLSDKRSYLINYVGSLSHDPWDMRKKMDSYLKGRLSNRYRYAHAPEWREIMQDSWISLTPRGFGRTAFHVVEAIQMGLIPVHIYNQTKWVPYGDVFDKVGFAVTLDELPALVDELEKWTTQDFLDREKVVAQYRETHFVPGAVMVHIQHFLTREAESDLVCQPLPSTTRMS